MGISSEGQVYANEIIRTWPHNGRDPSTPKATPFPLRMTVERCRPHQGYTHSTPKATPFPLRVTVFLRDFRVEPLDYGSKMLPLQKHLIPKIPLITISEPSSDLPIESLINNYYRFNPLPPHVIFAFGVKKFSTV